MVLELVSRNLVKPVGGAGMPAGMPGQFLKYKLNKQEFCLRYSPTVPIVYISLIKHIKTGTVDTATGAFRRVHHQTEDGEDVTVVKGPMRGQMFDSRGSLQPTIAVITVHYFEKMAVDAMMTNKQTFVRYATVGG